VIRSEYHVLRITLFRSLYTDHEDTIAAISTPLGEGGIGIVRVSGHHALDIVQEIFTGSQLSDLHSAPTYSLHHGYIVHPDTNMIIDETLVTVMRAPRSYTREDVVEINCHGGILPLRNVLDIVLSRGARLASPGEFTKRAFLNGRIDLSQAESVLDIIRAKTDAGLQLAVQQLQGKLSKKVKSIHIDLKHLLAALEASIDFPEDDIELISPFQIVSELDQSLGQIEYLLVSAYEGKIVRDGLSVAIVGKPNVGKSSLLNVLLEEERAIVTPIPGTTRDTIEDYINLNGIPVRLIDTAGIRDTDNQIEMLGVARSRDAIKQADLILCMFDISVPWSLEDDELLQTVKDKDIMVTINKIDLPAIVSIQDMVSKFSEPVPTLSISIKEHRGLDQLKQTLIDHVLTIPFESVEVTNSRHKRALSLTKESLGRARSAAEANMSQEFIALDVREALDHLGEITGETTREDILEEIFSTFCIGK
jgi:tRNA modification GTPase